MIKKLIFWYYRRYLSIVHPEELYQILRAIKKTYKVNSMGRPTTWELRKYKVAGEYALNIKSMDQIAEEYNITRERIRQIAWRIYWDYKRGVYNEESY